MRPDAPLLLGGFEPFAGDRVNPSQDVARALDGQVVAGRRVVGVTLPCTFDGAWPVLRAAIERDRPAVVLALGVAADRDACCVESWAVNEDLATIPDNAGAMPRGTPVVPGGPARLATTLPVDQAVAALRAAGLPARASGSAGRYVCNHLFYALLHGLASQPAADRPLAGFLHLPAYPAQAARRGLPGASLPSLRRAAALALAVGAAAATG